MGSVFSLYGQSPKQTIRGTVVDKDIRLPLIGATVLLLNTDPVKGGTTDEDGAFRIEGLEVGRYDLQVSYLGYEPVLIPQLLVGSGKEVVLEIELAESVESLEEVTVVATDQDKGRALNEMAVVSARSFSVEETSRYAGSMNDPLRMAQAFAGVSTAGNSYNEILIRGNAAKGLLWRIEGIEVPNPNHFASGEGGSGGGVSILSNTVLANSDFFTGAFPAEYGNALSGVFDIQLRRGNNEKREYAIQVGVLGVQAAVEGPFSKNSKASYLANYRYSTLSLLNKFGFEVNEATVIPEYQDLTFNITIPTSKAGRFTLFGVGGLSDGTRYAERDSSEWVTDSDRFDDGSASKVGVIGMTYTYLMKNNKTYVKLTGAFSGEESILRQDSLDNQYTPLLNYQTDNLNTAARAKAMVHHKFNARHLLQAGINYSWLGFRYGSTTLNPALGDYEGFAQHLESDLIQSFIQWQWKPVQGLELNSGFHHTSFLLNNNHVIEPRAGLRWQAAPRVALSFGTGLHSRLEPISIYANNLAYPLSTPGFIFDGGDSFLFSPRSTLRLTQSWHNVVGVNWSVAPQLRFNAEMYYQYLFNVPVKNDPASTLSTINYSHFDPDYGFERDGLVNKGRGANYGVEFTLERFFQDNYYFMVTSSLFKSRFQPLDGIWRNTRFDQTYVFNALGGKEVLLGKDKQHILGFNLRLVWTGGLRTTPIDLAASREQGREVLVEEQLFEDRLPGFFRIDTGFSYRWNKNRYSLVTSIDIQNTTNRRNVQNRYFDARAGAVVTVYQLGIVPIINLRLEF